MATDATAAAGQPTVIAPGQSKTITVTIKPSGEKGTHVSGTLNLVTTPLGAPTFKTTGDLLAQLPYSYTIG